MSNCCGNSGHGYGGGHGKTQVRANPDIHDQNHATHGGQATGHAELAEPGTKGLNWAWVIGAVILLAVVGFYLRQ